MRLVIFLILILCGWMRGWLPIMVIFSPKDPVSLMVFFMPVLGKRRKTLIVASLPRMYA